MKAYESRAPESEAERLNKRLKREAYYWAKLSHRNITPFLGYQSGEEPLLISPFYQNGSLVKYLEDHPQAPKLKLLSQTAQGLIYLHNLVPPAVHGDIKPDNVLVNDNFEASLCDFGLSRFIEDIRTGLTTSGGPGGGGYGYIAPEILNGEETVRKTTETDVFAFGGLILFALSGKSPFHDKIASITIVAVSSGKTPQKHKHSSIPEDATIWSLMDRCWAVEPTDRPKMQEVYEILGDEEQHFNAKGALRRTANLVMSKGVWSGST